MNRALRYSWISLGREWRAGELRILALALVIAVAAVTSVSFFTDRVQRAMSLQATELLGADLSITSPQPIPGEFAREARERGLDTARYVSFPSVVVAGDDSELAELKAVSDGWPLRGTARVSEALFGEEQETRSVPGSGEAWVEARLLQLLELSVGDSLEVGEISLSITRVLTYEPDRGGDLFQLAPRLMLNVEDLEATGLIVPGSRVNHRFLVAGDEAAINRYREWASAELAENQRLETVADAQPALRNAIARGEQFLSLAALVAVLLAGGAVAVAARHYSDRQSDTSAVMRCLGASRRFVLQVFTLRLLWLALLASTVGLVLGFAAQGVLAWLLSGWFATELP
ncbi:ABC transporter permease, partial [Ectothiorhodospira haloalkaliphila]